VKSRVLPTLIVGLVGAVIGSFVMMLYASTHFANVAGPNHTPPAVAAAPLASSVSGVSDQTRIVSAVKRTKASVVAITEDINGQQVVPVDPFFQQFFGGGPGIVRKYKGQASGSGFVYNDQGYIVTNAHVVRPPTGGTVSNLKVVFANGDRVPAHVVAVDIGADIALIKVDNYHKLPPPLQLADSDKLEQGQWAIAIGEPYELQQTVTLGVVSAFNRNEQVSEGNLSYDFKGLLQTSAPINPGNSGGPLIDIDGKVIGINQLTNEGAQGIGFAIPSNTVASVAKELLKDPGIHQGTNTGFAGFAPADLTPGLKNQIGYSGNQGLAVVEVVPGSPADKAGMEPGDVILSADGKTFDKASDLRTYIGSKKPGDIIRFTVWAQGLKKLVAVTLEEKPAGVPVQQQQGP
jgi:serine protease Do